MQITLEDDLIYIYLIDPSVIKSVGTITNVNGYLIHDRAGNWLGFRIENSQYDNRRPIELPPLANNVFRSVITDGYIDILFAKDVKADCFYEQECHLDTFNGEIVGIEITRYTNNPRGKMKWVQTFRLDE